MFEKRRSVICRHQRMPYSKTIIQSARTTEDFAAQHYIQAIRRHGIRLQSALFEYQTSYESLGTGGKCIDSFLELGRQTWAIHRI